MKANDYFVSNAELPANWPLNWQFPAEIWPPGYPQKFPAELHLIASYSSKLLVVKIQNEYGEDVTDLDNQFVQVCAKEGDNIVRVKVAGDEAWKKSALLKISKGRAVAVLEYEVDRMKGNVADINISVYSFTGGEVTL